MATKPVLHLDYNFANRLIMGKFLALITLFPVLAFAQVPAPKAITKKTLPQFEDVASQAGLTVSHISTADKKFIVESMSGGAGLIDCDNDGKLDILTVNGSTIERF